MLDQAVAAGVFPHAELLVARKGRVLGHFRAGRAARGAHFFDLASLTKPLVTTVLCMLAVQEGKLDLHATVARTFKTGTLGAVTIASLLHHTSGLIDWFDFARSPISRHKILENILNDPMLRRKTGATLYSDLGFIVLGEILEKIHGRSLDKIFATRVARPLKIQASLFFQPTKISSGMNAQKRPRLPKAAHRFFPTEICAWRGRTIQGEVMDENAWILGGVAGHAGLFGTAKAVHRLLLELRRARFGKSRLIKAETFAAFCTPDVRRRLSERHFTLGFDTPTRPGSQSGRYFSKNSIGHLGYSGTSFWWDLEKDVWIILLSNRCMPTRENKKLSVFRPRLHDAIMKSI